MNDTLSQNEINKAVGAKLREFRALRGVSQANVAEAIGRTFQQVQKYERGKNRISPGVLVEICTFLNVAPADFFEGLNRLPSEVAKEAAREIMELVRSYNELTPGGRATLRMIARNMAAPSASTIAAE